jgi:hypothetical protein
MSDPAPHLATRSRSSGRFRRSDNAWEAVVREELNKLRRRSARSARSVAPARPMQPAEAPAEAAA